MASKMQPLDSSFAEPGKKANRRRSRSTELLQTSEFQPESMETNAAEFPVEQQSPAQVRAPTVGESAGPKWREGVTVKSFDNGTEVMVSQQGLKDSDADMIVALLTDNVVTKLTLADNQLGDDAAAKIAEGLKTNTSLTYLTMSKNAVGAAGGKKLAEALKLNSSLKTLFLSGNPLGDSLAAIKEANAARACPMDDGLNGLVL